MSKVNDGNSRREFITAGIGAAALATIGFNRPVLGQDQSNYVSVMVSFRMQQGKEKDAVALLTGLTAAVKENEPGALSYAAHRHADDPLKITFFEVYKDQEALNGHRTAAHLQAFLPKFGEVFEQGAEVSNLTRVAGFTRDS